MILNEKSIANLDGKRQVKERVPLLRKHLVMLCS